MSSRVRQWFDSMDKSGKGIVTCQDLQLALTQGNLHFSLATVAQLIRLHSVNRAPRLTYPEFQNLHKFLQDTQKSFSEANPSNEGTLSYNQLANVLKRAGYNMEQAVFTRLMEAFDPEEKRCIDLTAFIRLTMFFKSSTEAFTAFDPRQTGTVTLDYSQFLYAATNVI